jgi:hypothetical protein
MKRIFYASGSVVTGDRMAEAIVHYAEILAMRETSDTIDVPIALDSGSMGRAQMLVGPASQLVVVPEEGAFEEPEDDDTLEELRRRGISHGSPKALARDDGDSTDYVDSSGFATASENNPA